MNVGFHTLKVRFTWLTEASGREQLNDAQYRFAQLCGGNQTHRMEMCTVLSCWVESSSSLSLGTKK
ncbi:hypothetical protein EYF80_036411 [Liparis tanakae]|uniref:Uncharacterized protein n=1 Tax=Liparis tanakae TaxID=230148 RepID=A0A4Z2GKN5_9TELE|nr:hypothetical protein EYF80_036411 [Liparis tanakae]